MTVEPTHPALPQELFAAGDAAEHLHLHRLLGDAEARGDFLLGEALELSEHDNFAAPRRQRIDGFGEQPYFVAAARGFGGVRLVLYDGQGRQICYGDRGRDSIPAHKIECKVPRHLEQECAAGVDRPGGAGPPDPEKGLLNHIVDIANGRERAFQVCPERALVRSDLLREPAGLLCR